MQNQFFLYGLELKNRTKTNRIDNGSVPFLFGLFCSFAFDTDRSVQQSYQMTQRRHQQNAQPQIGCAVSIQYHHWGSKHNRIPTESCQVLHIMTKIQHVETQVALANGQISRLQTSTFSLLCMPNTDRSQEHLQQQTYKGCPQSNHPHLISLTQAVDSTRKPSDRPMRRQNNPQTSLI